MTRSLKQLQSLEMDQLKRRGFYPKDETEVLLRLGEEMGEVFEAVREKQAKRVLSHEVVDIFWNLLRLCELKGIDLERAFMEKLKKNETRPLAKKVTDISENS